MKWWLSLQNANRLIVGLGNPGKSYSMTRHNLGFILIEDFAKKHGFTFSRSKTVLGELAQSNFQGNKIFLLMPKTYMNLSGRSVQKCLAYYKLAVSELLVIVDDISLPFGKFRFREEGSSGGHNGLKSIEQSLATNKYARLKCGIGRDENQDLSDYVLSPFNHDELIRIPTVCKEGNQFIEDWIKKGDQS